MTDAAVRSPTRTGRARPSVADGVVAVGVAAFVAVLGVTAAVCGVQFFYVGDNPESFIPLWHHFGTELLAGNWWTMESSGWMGGNYAGEAAYAQWNPFLLAAYVVVSFFSNLALGAAAIMIPMLSLLGAGAFVLMRTYGVRQSVAAAMAAALPVTGFTLFYEAAGWPAGLAAFLGVTWFWVSVRKQVQQKWPPFAAFAFGYLAVTTGNPYAILGILIVLAGEFIELLVSRRHRDALILVVTGVTVGMVTLLVFLPLLGVQEITLRQQLAVLGNDTFMVPDLGDLAASSTSSYLPTITNWGGSTIETLPSTYLAWFVLPLLPWLKWRSIWSTLRTNIALLVIFVVFSVAVLAPSNVWLFRWPIRLIEYLYLVVLVLLALGVSAGVKPLSRGRLAASSVIVLIGAFLAFSATPGGAKIHLVGLVLTAALLASLAYVWNRWGARPAMAVILAGTVLTTAFQTTVYPRAQPTALPPASLATMSENAATFEGTVLQLAAQSQTEPAAMASAKILFGNLSAPLEYESINRYTGIGFKAFSDALCIDYKGSTCPGAYDALWTPVEDTHGNLADALQIGTLVIGRASYPEVVAEGPPAGWEEISSDEFRVVWVRASPLEHNGRVSGTSTGVEARSVSSTETKETVEVSASAAGRVTFARLAWPGYEVRIDGRPATPLISDEGLLQVDVPADESNITIAYATPGLQLGWVACAAGAVIALLLSLFWLIRRLRPRERSAGGRNSASRAS